MKIKNQPFKDSTEQLEEIFSMWPFTLSDFQKHAIKGIIDKKHIIITAHTGNGKTLAADFAITHFVGNGKKVIYTSPIKALTNQKYNTFQEKYPDISFGIITGDVSMNPGADVIFCTTEILRNTLFKQKWLDCETAEKKKEITLDIEISPEELGAVVYDEIHYIMDKDRGPVWHESIMMLPDTVQIIGLSATIDKPEILANWIETGKNREVWLCPTNNRVIPQHHYAFFTMPKSSLQQLPSQYKGLFGDIYEKEITLKQPDDYFNEKNYFNLKKAFKYIYDNKIFIDRSFVLNQLIRFLKIRNYMPAICFVYSRKQVEQIAGKINISLFEEGDKTPSIIENECKQLLIRKMNNWKEYINLPEYRFLIKILQKGIAIHHAGMIQVFKEMIEYLFEKKYIKLLIATETFAVGVDMPAQSVIFTSLQKFNGTKFRYLEPHEYSQQSGRAGRRGQTEKIGRVWHMVNLFDIRNALPDVNTYKNIVDGKPQSFSSTFKIHFNLILRLMSMNKNDTLVEFMEKSLLSTDLEKEKLNIVNNIKHTELVLEKKTSLPYSVDTSLLEEYHHIINTIQYSTRKKRKQMERRKSELIGSNKIFEKEYLRFSDIQNTLKKLKKNQIYLRNIDNYIIERINLHKQILEESKFITDNQLTEKGIIAANLQEVHCLAMGELLQNNIFNEINTIEFASILSIFTNVSVKKEDSIIKPEYVNVSQKVIHILRQIENNYHKYYDIETKNMTDFIYDYEIHFNMCELVYKWCSSDSMESCNKIFEEALYYNISRGEFTKALMKINNVAHELKKIAEIQGNMLLLSLATTIPDITLKYIATNQSLYL